MRFICSHCEKVLEHGDAGFGREVRCEYCGEMTLVPASRLALGAVLDDFLILGPIREGRTSIIFRAHQLSLRRDLALKLLKQEYAARRQAVEDFVREARFTARVNHPNIVHTYAIGQVGDTHFAAQELIPGGSLASRLAAGRVLSVTEALSLAAQMVAALGHLWRELQLVHRDVKPGNILCHDEGEVKLIGFGLACTAEELAANGPADEIVGSVPYLSPEHLLGEPMDVRSDLYSLGATLYHAVTGQLPHPGETPAEIVHKHLHDDVISATRVRSEIPVEVALLLDRLLARECEERFPGVEILARDLVAIGNQEGLQLGRHFDSWW